MRVANKVGYAWGVRIECRLRTIVYSHIIRHSRIQCQRGISNWPLWLKTYCSTRTKNCHAEAAARVTSSLELLLRLQLPEHNRTNNPRFADTHIDTYIDTYIDTHIDTYIDTYIHRYTHRQTDRQPASQPGRQTDRQTYIHNMISTKQLRNAGGHQCLMVALV